MCFVYINQICMLYSRTKCTVAITEVMKLKAYAKLGPEFPQHLEKWLTFKQNFTFLSYTFFCFKLI